MSHQMLSGSLSSQKQEERETSLLKKMEERGKGEGKVCRRMEKMVFESPHISFLMQAISPDGSPAFSFLVLLSYSNGLLRHEPFYRSFLVDPSL